MGLLYVYLDDLYSPIITTPINLDATLRLDSGRCFLGITSATGDTHWQAHDVLDWRFKSLFLDEVYYAPQIINGEGAIGCVNDSVCSRLPNYDNYLRSSTGPLHGSCN